jgi:hypothetical protein
MTELSATGRDDRDRPPRPPAAIPGADKPGLTEVNSADHAPNANGPGQVDGFADDVETGVVDAARELADRRQSRAIG